MSFIGAMVTDGGKRGLSDMLGTKNNYEAQGVDPSLIGDAYNRNVSNMDRQSEFLNALGAQQGLGHQQDVFGMQRNLAGQLQDMGNGIGPNPALAQLNQATGQNIAAQSALMAGQRGARANPALLARLAAQHGGALQQQAVGQGATLQAQQQMSALAQLQQQQGMMAGLANQQVNQQQQGLSALTNAGLQHQSNLMGLQSNANSVNAGVANQNTQTQGQLIGGLIKGGSSALAAGAHGGDVRAMPMLGGGKVPGQPEVGHNSYKNDTVPAMLSPGEQVIDLNTLHDSGPVGEAARFVAHHINQRNQRMACGGMVKGYAEGGEAKPDEVPVKMPDPQKARDAWKGFSEGQTLSKGIENVKNEWNTYFGGNQNAKGYADGGGVNMGDIGEGVGNYLVNPLLRGVEYIGQKAINLTHSMGNTAGELTQGLQKGTGMYLPGSTVNPTRPPAALPMEEEAPQNYQMPVQPQAAPAPPAPAPFDPYKGVNRMQGYDTSAEGLLGQSLAEGDIAKEQAKILAEKQQREVDHEKAVASKANEYSSRVNDVLKNMKDIDPNNYMKSLSGGQRAMTAIGLILGGIGSGLAGGENPAMQYLMKNVDKDIDAQKANLGKQNNLLSAYRDQYKDDVAALQMTRATMLGQIEDRMKEEALKKGDQLSLSRMQQALGPIQVAKAQATVAAAQATEMQRRVAQGDITALPKEQREAIMDQRSLMVPGYGMALTKEGASKANEKVALFNTTMDGIKELQSMVGRSSSLSLEDRARAQTIATMLKGNLRPDLVGPGAVSESEWKILDSIITDPTNITQLDSTSKVRLSTLGRRITNGFNSNLKQFGLKPQASSGFTPR